MVSEEDELVWERKAREIVCNTMIMPTETTLVGSVRFASKISLASCLSPPLPIRSSSSSSPSPSFRSDIGNGNGGSKDTDHYHEFYKMRARLLFLLTRKKKKVTTLASSDLAANMVFKRSKHTATPGRKQFLGADNGDQRVSSRKRGGFWSFFYSSSSSSCSTTTSTTSSSSKTGASKSMDKSFRDKAAEATNSSVGKQKKKCPGSSLSEKSEIAEDEEDDDGSNSQSTASYSSFERKVTRTRYVGCGSRRFSADLFERISAGFGECSTLRRVESQREGKSKVSASNDQRGGSGSGHNQKCMKERVKCGGIFAGFIRI